MSAGISIRDFADRVGVSETAVRKAIKSGKITDKSIDRTNPNRPQIDALKAAAEWGKSYDPNRPRTSAVTDVIKVAATREAPRGKLVKDDPAQTEEGNKLATVRRTQAEIALQNSALDLQIKKGKYVDKSKVYKALFKAGQDVRSTFQALPDRVIDNILAAKSRHEAHEILTDAISDALEQLADAVNRDMML